MFIVADLVSFSAQPVRLLSHNSTYSRVGHIYSVRESASRHQSQNMEGYQVDKEYITSPRGHLQIKYNYLVMGKIQQSSH